MSDEKLLIHIKNTSIKSLEKYVTMDKDADVEDIFDLYGNDRQFRFFYNKKQMFDGKLSDYGIKPLPSTLPLEESKQYIEIDSSLRIGGGPSIGIYVTSVKIQTGGESTKLTRNHATRRHRKIDELCNNIKMFTFDYHRGYSTVDAKTPSPLGEIKSVPIESGKYRIVMNMMYISGGYRLDFKSINNNNVYIFDVANDKVIDVSFSADWPEYDSTIDREIEVTLKPRTILESGKLYLLCINSNTYNKCDYSYMMKVMNPYYPAGSEFADEEGLLWRSPLAGQFVYAFKFV